MKEQQPKVVPNLYSFDSKTFFSLISTAMNQIKLQTMQFMIFTFIHAVKVQTCPGC